METVVPDITAELPGLTVEPPTATCELESGVTVAPPTVTGVVFCTDTARTGFEEESGGEVFPAAPVLPIAVAVTPPAVGVVAGAG